jgi:WD40 repeat protein
VAETLRGHDGSVESVAVTADGTWIVSGGLDDTVLVWDRTTQKCLRSFSNNFTGKLSGDALLASADLSATSRRISLKFVAAQFC